MSDDTFDISRRKVLGSIGVIGAGSAVAGAGTMAYFSDTEESKNNTVTAGTLDLEVNGYNDIPNNVVNFDNFAPGDEETYELTLENTGSVDGDLYIKFDADGPLKEYLDLSYNFVGGGSGDVDLSSAPTGWMDTYKDVGDKAEGSITVTLPSSVGNGAQGESVNIDVAMQLVQHGGSP